MFEKTKAGFIPSAETLALIGTCVLGLTDVVLITEAGPLGLPGPRIVYVNDAFERQTGYRRDEVIGKTPRILQGPLTSQPELRRMRLAFENWECVRVELINYKKNGESFCVEMDIVPVADARGWYTHWVAVQRDVTARKRLETEAATREHQRTESIGTLSIGIAHDFNNIIASILGNIVLGRQDIEDGRDALRALEQINRAAERARGLVQQILAYARRQKQLLVRQPMAPLVQTSVDLLRAALPAGVSITVSLDGGYLDVLADATQVNQVILNLGTNAWHAMKGRPGHIDIRLRSLVGPSTPGGAAVRQALLEIEDDGDGMDAVTLAQAFDPYFTTKAIGQGTGLGLSVVWGIVKAHGATITVDSTLHEGSTFRLLFPVLDVEAHRLSETGEPGRAAVPVSPLPAGGGRRVLVVDDDDVVLLMLGGLLERAGFRVTATPTGREALEVLRADPHAFDAVVTDMNMPETSGLQLARAVASIRSDLPVVLGSGFVGEELAAEASSVGVARVYMKEMSAEVLPRLLCEVMDARFAPRPALSTE